MQQPQLWTLRFIVPVFDHGLNKSFINVCLLGDLMSADRRGLRFGSVLSEQQCLLCTAWPFIDYVDMMALVAEWCSLMLSNGDAHLWTPTAHAWASVGCAATQSPRETSSSASPGSDQETYSPKLFGQTSGHKYTSLEWAVTDTKSHSNTRND